MGWVVDEHEAIKAFAVQLMQAARHVAGREAALQPHEVDDVAMDVVVAFLERPLVVIAQYQVPIAFAVACCRSRTVDHHRRQRAQRGEGARTVVATDGTVAARRSVEHLDERTTAIAAARTAASPVDDIVADRLAVRQAVAPLGRDDRRLLWLVHGEGRTVTDAAVVVGQSRSHVSRRLGAILASVA